jgi:hypothetical protein
MAASGHFRRFHPMLADALPTSARQCKSHPPIFVMELMAAMIDPQPSREPFQEPHGH